MMQKWLEKLWRLEKNPIDSSEMGIYPDESIRFAVGIDTDKRQIRILFHEPIDSLNMNEDEADNFALLLIRKSGIIREMKREEEYGEVSQRQHGCG